MQNACSEEAFIIILISSDLVKLIPIKKGNRENERFERERLEGSLISLHRVDKL